MKFGKRWLVAGLVGAFLIGGAILWWIPKQETKNAGENAPPAVDGANDPTKVLFWYDPMYPDRHFDEPGKSPFMDMALLPKYAQSGASTVVSIAPDMVQNLGIRTAPVTRGSSGRDVRAAGRVEVDERSVRRVTVRAPGWIEVLHVRADGDHVRAHELLAQVYSPAFDTAQRELLLALDSGDESLIGAARAQLDALGVDGAQRVALERSRQPARHIDVYSPIEGYVMALMKREGDAVERDTVMFEIASHDPVWIVADVPEAQAGSVRVGQAIVAAVATYPGRAFEGRVDYLYPTLDSATRTLRVRTVFDNPDDALHPGMYANVAFAGERASEQLSVPSEAVIRTGRRNVVIIAEDSGRYRPVGVRIGDEHDGMTTILEGLQDGDRVVVSGQFLIDSEASIRGAYDRMADADESARVTP